MVAVTRRAATIVAAALTCAVSIGACGSSKGSSATTAADLDIAHIEHAIERSIMQQRHLKSTVVCPATVPQRPGKFPCVATTYSVKKPHEKIKTPFVVTVHNDRGYVTYIGK
jgi:hypothetical protein